MATTTHHVTFDRVEVADLIRRLASALAGSTEDSIPLTLTFRPGFYGGEAHDEVQITASTSLFAVRGEVTSTETY
jgi:hypothetical protein